MSYNVESFPISVICILTSCERNVDILINSLTGEAGTRSAKPENDCGMVIRTRRIKFKKALVYNQSSLFSQL